MKLSARGLTLIELLVVIAVTGIIGVYTLSNFRSFGRDQNLKQSVLDVVSILRLAQANAETNTICKDQYGAIWQVEFMGDGITVNLNCEEPTSILKKTIKLDEKDKSIGVKEVSGSSCPSGLPVTVNFTRLPNSTSSQAVTSFPGYDSCRTLVITLTNGTPNYKSLTVESGGRIYAQ